MIRISISNGLVLAPAFRRLGGELNLSGKNPLEEFQVSNHCSSSGLIRVER